MGGSASLRAECRSQIQASRDEAAWQSQLRNEEQDADTATVEGVQGITDTGFLQQTQPFRIPVFSPHPTGMRTEKDCTLALKMLMPRPSKPFVQSKQVPYNSITSRAYPEISSC